MTTCGFLINMYLDMLWELFFFFLKRLKPFPLSTCSRSWCTTPSVAHLVAVTQQRSQFFCSAATRFSSGSCLRCSCVCRSTRGCNCSKSSSKLLLSKKTPILLSFYHISVKQNEISLLFDTISDVSMCLQL